ncbi:MAG: ribonuclease Z [Anaerolineae bacterium]|nr:ribonuclease Z [Anaerolineae bacterium]
MKIVLLGTNGWFDTATGNTPCILVQAETFDLIFDAGYGMTKVDRYIDGSKPVYLLISHFHLDHLIGLHTLPKHKFQKGLHIIGQPGTHAALEGLMSPVYSIPLDTLPFPVDVAEVNGSVPNGLPFQLTALPLIHSGPCMGFRVECENKVITYCTDTGECENAVILARGADLFLTECSLKPGVAPSPNWPHLSPDLAAKMAVDAGAKKLVLVHFDPTQYPSLSMRSEAETRARSIFADSVAGLDGMEFYLA